MNWEQVLPSVITGLFGLFAGGGVVLKFMEYRQQRDLQSSTEEQETTKARILDDAAMRAELWRRLEQLEQVQREMVKQIIEYERAIAAAKTEAADWMRLASESEEEIKLLKVELDHQRCLYAELEKRFNDWDRVRNQ